MNQYLLRVWGKDKEAISTLRAPDAVEPHEVLCYWFATGVERETFIDTFPSACWIMCRRVNPEDGVDTHAYTVALITLTLPDGRVGMFEQNFGFGYPDESVEYMWREGNYACDCNKRLFLVRECGIDPQFEEANDANFQCGDTIKLEALEIYHRKVIQ